MVQSKILFLRSRIDEGSPDVSNEYQSFDHGLLHVVPAGQISSRCRNRHKNSQCQYRLKLCLLILVAVGLAENFQRNWARFSYLPAKYRRYRTRRITASLAKLAKMSKATRTIHISTAPTKTISTINLACSRTFAIEFRI